MIMSKEELDSYKEVMKQHGEHEGKGIFDLSTCSICQWKNKNSIAETLQRISHKKDIGINNWP